MKTIVAYIFFIFLTLYSPAQNIHIQEIQGENLKDNFIELMQNDSIIYLKKLHYCKKEKTPVILISVTPIETEKYLLKISCSSYNYFKNDNLLGDYYYKYIVYNNIYYVHISEVKIPLYKILGKDVFAKTKIFNEGKMKRKIKNQSIGLDEDSGEVQILTISDKKIKSYATVGYQFYYPKKNDLNYYEELLDMKID